MPSRLENEIRFVPELKSYIFYADPDQDRRVQANTPEYFAWIASLKSFHFSGKEGHFTARKEPQKNIDGSTSRRAYWTAYMKSNGKQLRKYLGTTDKLSIEHLESAGKHLAEKASHQPPAEKKLRKRAEKREVLYARIELRDKEIAQLKKQIEEQKRSMLKMQARIQQLENMLRAKRL
jgi:hypothetical protein